MLRPLFSLPLFLGSSFLRFLFASVNFNCSVFLLNFTLILLPSLKLSFQNFFRDGVFHVFLECTAKRARPECRVKSFSARNSFAGC